MPITHTDGQTYFSQAELENAIKDRVKNVEEKVRTAETAKTDAETKLKAAETEAAKVAAVEKRAADAEAKALAAEGGLSRFKAITKHGITDPDTIEAVEMAHEKAMAKAPEKDRVGLDVYLDAAKADPTILPTYLRGSFDQKADPKRVDPKADPKGEPKQPERPAWASAASGQQAVVPGGTPKFADQVRATKSMEELIALQAARTAR